MVELPKGGNTAVAGPVIHTSLRTGLAPGSIDICALLVDEQRRVRSEKDFVFFNQEHSGCGSTRRVSPVEIEINLDLVPAAVDAIVVAASLDDVVSGSVADNGGGEIVVSNDGGAAISHTFSGLTTERCVIAVEVYRRGGTWKIRAVSQGFSDLAELVTAFGLDTVDDAADQQVPDDRAAPSEPQPVSGAVPLRTGELIDHVRGGAAARRAASTLTERFPTWLGHLPQHRIPEQQKQPGYKAQRIAQAARITADIAEQTERVETMLRHLPVGDLSIRALLKLIDAPAEPPQADGPTARRGEQSSSAPPSTYLATPLEQLHAAAADPAHRDAVHAWLWLGLHATDLQPSFGHPENINVAPDGSKIVIDIRLPERTAIIPAHSAAYYTKGNDTISYRAAWPKKQARLTEVLFSASLIAHAYTIATAAAAARLPDTLPLVVNGWEIAVNPATGLPERICRATLVASTHNLAGIDPRGVDPVACLRSLAGSVDDSGRVPPIDQATSSSPAGRQVDLTTIDPFEFEALITELARAMGYDAYQTQRSHDHGVDVYVESRDTLASGRIVISAKRHNRVINPEHVHALANVVNDQGAIKGILVTTSSFGPESYRIARDRPLELVDGQQLRSWLQEYLGMTGHS